MACDNITYFRIPNGRAGQCGVKQSIQVTDCPQLEALAADAQCCTPGKLATALKGITCYGANSR